MLNTYLTWLINWRRLIVAVTIILVAMIGSGIRFLNFTTDYRVFYGEDHPILQTLNRLHNTYTKDDTILFVITPKDGEVFTPQTLASIQWLTDAAWEMPYTQRVDSLQNFQYSYGLNDELIVRDLYANPERLSHRAIAQIRTTAQHEILLKDRLIAEDSDVTGVLVTVQLPGIDELHEVPAVAASARELARQLAEKNPNLEIRLTGGVMMSNAFPEASQHDIETLIPVMFSIVFVVLGLLLRSIPATLGALVVILFSIVATMGIAGWLGFKLSPPSAGTPNIILTIAVADCVHILVSFLHEMHGDGIRPLSSKKQRIKATEEALRINLKAIFLTSLTTAIGFLSLNFSDSPPFHDLGNLVAIGVGFAFILSVVFLPALMMLMPMRIRPYRAQGSHLMDSVSHFITRRGGTLIIGMAVLLIGLVSFLPRNELNDDSIKYFSADHTFRADTEYATEHLTGMYLMEYSLQAQAPGGINDPLYLRVLDDFSEWYRTQPETLHVYSIADILKRLNKNMHDDDPDWYRVPDSRELAAQYLLLYEMSLPEGLDLNDRINIDKSASRFTATLHTLSSNEILDLDRRAHHWLVQHAPAYMLSEATSPYLIFSHIGRSNITGMLVGTAVALVLISITLMFALKSVSMGLLSLLPNLIPAVMAFGLWGIIDGQINMGLSVVASLTLGIVVDDTVHFLSTYLYARRDLKLNAEDAINYTFSHVGTALWITSLVLASGFLVLTFSDFELNAKLGLMTAITILFALMADFLLLPPLLLLKDRWHKRYGPLNHKG